MITKHRTRHGFNLGRVLLGALLLMTGCHRAPSGPVYDLPALVGTQWDAAQKTLGAPSAAPAPSADTGQATFRRNDVKLVVDYRTRSGRITGMLLTPAEPVKNDDRADLLKLGNLREGDPRYSVEFSEDPGDVARTAAVKVTPASKNHSVVMRVSGPSQVQISYSAPQSLGLSTQPNQPFMTVPPWQAPLSAPSGTVLSLQAVPFRDTVVPNDPTSVQIEVDGKVAAQSGLANGTATCTLELD